MNAINAARKQSVLSDRSGKAVVSLLIIIILVVGILFFTSYHIVKTSDGIKIYSKDGFFFKYTYLDMTALTFADLKDHPEVVAAMAEAGDLKYVPGGQALMLAEKAGYDVGEVVTKFNDENQVKKFIDKWGKRGRDKIKELESRMDISGKVDKSKAFVKDKVKKVKKWFNKQ